MKHIFDIILFCFILSIEGLIFAKKSTKQPVKTEQDAVSWLNKYGYNPCLDSAVQCSLSFKSIIQDYQKRFRLTITGKLDETTKQHMNRPRCGNKDKPIAELVANQLSQKWSRSSLTYAIQGYSTQISQAKTKQIIRDAFDAWLENIPLKIEETCSTCQSDFTINFASDNHNDGYPFDGVGGTLAHAFFPENGRVHFDKDEHWTESFDGLHTNLFLVAVHEIGHALGLDHTYDETSIMYPSYQLMPKNKILPQFDRDGIQRLYGRKQSSSSTSVTTRSTTTTTTTRRGITTSRSSVTVPGGRSHPRCRLFIDAAFKHPDGTLHTFKSGVLWRYLPNEQRWEDDTNSYTKKYANLPSKLAAGVYNSQKKEVLFFTSSDVYYYTIDYNNQATYERSESLPRNLRNSIVGAIYYRDQVYVITRKTIRLFQSSGLFSRSSERDLSDEFPGLTGRVATAFSYGDLHHFFTNDGRVYIWDERSGGWKTSDRSMETGWFACSGAETYSVNDDQAKKPSKNRGSYSHRHHQHHHHY